MKKEALGLLENQSGNGYLDLYYADETRVSEEGYVPYGWQFTDEDVYVPSSRGGAVNCFGLLSRGMGFHYEVTGGTVNADFLIGFLERFSFGLKKLTVVVLDNASPHKAKKLTERLAIWQERGLYLFYLPPYSPKLNIIERLWKEIKEGWLKPEDYQTADTLFYAVNRILANVGKELKINFSGFNQNYV